MLEFNIEKDAPSITEIEVEKARLEAEIAETSENSLCFKNYIPGSVVATVAIIAIGIFFPNATMLALFSALVGAVCFQASQKGEGRMHQSLLARGIAKLREHPVSPPLAGSILFLGMFVASVVLDVIFPVALICTVLSFSLSMFTSSWIDSKITSSEIAAAELRSKADGLSIVSQDKCIALNKAMACKEISTYRHSVIAQGRQFLNVEAELAQSYFLSAEMKGLAVAWEHSAAESVKARAAQAKKACDNIYAVV